MEYCDGSHSYVMKKLAGVMCSIFYVSVTIANLVMVSGDGANKKMACACCCVLGFGLSNGLTVPILLYEMDHNCATVRYIVKWDIGIGVLHFIGGLINLNPKGYSAFIGVASSIYSLYVDISGFEDEIFCDFKSGLIGIIVLDSLELLIDSVAICAKFFGGSG
jgi:hypothetical protein